MVAEATPANAVPAPATTITPTRALLVISRERNFI
jgi:hypothetical protein